MLPVACQELDPESLGVDIGIINILRVHHIVFGHSRLDVSPKVERSSRFSVMILIR